MSKLREKRGAGTIRALRPVAPMLKTWFLDVAYDFMDGGTFTAPEEDLLERVTDFYLERIEDLMLQYPYNRKEYKCI